MFFKREASAASAVPRVETRAAPPPPPVRAAVEPDGELDMRALGRALWRRKWAIILPTIVATILAAAAVEVISPRFKSSANILYEGRENIFLRPDAEKSMAERGLPDIEALTSQVQQVLSREVALDVIKKLKLNENPEFDPLIQGLSPFKYGLAVMGIGRNPLRMTAEERVLEAYYDKMTAFAIDRSRVITVEFEAHDPQLAARAANAIADSYLALQQRVRQQQTKAAGDWLQDQIEQLRPRVAAAEEKVEKFRANTNLFLGTNNTMLSNQQLGELNSQLALARGQKADAETRARLIRDMLRRGDPIEASDVINSDLIKRLSEQRVTLQAQLAEQSATLLDGHPRIKELKAQIHDLNAQSKIEAEKLVRSLENDAKIAAARVETIGAQLEQVRRQAATINQQEGVELRALEAEARTQRDLLDSALARYREATARENIGNAPADARIISRAVVSNTPSFPKKLPTILVAALAMLVISAGFVTTGELMRHSPASAAVPAAYGLSDTRLTAAPTHPALGVPFGAIDELARSLRAAGEGGRRIAVFGASHNVGTTMSAVTLARALARDARVVLVDLAVGAPNLAAVYAQAPGVAEVVRGLASFGDAITRDKLSRVHLVGAGRVGGDGAAIVSSQRLVLMLEALARTYDHVLIDAGATYEAAVERLYRLAPRAVLVATEEDSPATRAARERLGGAGYGEVAVLDGAATAAAAA